MNVEERTALISLMVAIIGAMFAIYQWNKSNKIRQAEFINQIIVKIRFDKDLVETMNMVENKKIWYDKNFYGSEMEIRIDALFSYLTYICYLYDTKIISRKEFSILEYKIKRVCLDRQSREYLLNSYHWARENLNASCSFQNLVNYLQKNVLSKDDVNSLRRFDKCEKQAWREGE